MAQGGGAASAAGKRKRGDRTYSADSTNDGSRPSPHAPGSLRLASHSNNQQNQQQNSYNNRDQYSPGGRGSRARGGRGGRGGAQGTRSPRDQAQSSGQAQTNAPLASPLGTRTPATPAPAEVPPVVHSKAPAVLTTATTQTSEVQTEPELPSVYFYEYVTQDCCKEWASGGRTTVLEVARRAKDTGDVITLDYVFQELIRAGLDGKLDPREAGAVVKELLEGDTMEEDVAEQLAQSEIATQFLDSFAIIAAISLKNRNLGVILRASGVSIDTARQELEVEVLESMGLVRGTFARMGVRNQTNILYRQSNYNLLREETEGYSKLITELFTTSSNEPPSAEVVAETFEKAKAMIGTFDMDVGRVLDVTLDVFAAVLVKQYRFFVKYLRTSSWWPQQEKPKSLSLDSLPRWAQPDTSGMSGLSDEEKAELQEARTARDVKFWDRAREIGLEAFFELGGRRVPTAALEAALAASDSEDLDEEQRWIKQTKTLPPPGNRTAAQILGFKLRFYSSQARNAQDVLPKNLIFLAALLIKIGFISLRDLYPHVWPEDDAMAKVKEQKVKEKAERERLKRPGGGTMNALMAAGALADDTVSPAILRQREAEAARAAAAARGEKAKSEAPVEPKEELPEPLDQKIQLLKSLLAIGAIPEALYILGRFPWLPEYVPDLPDHIHRILHHSLQKLYDSTRPLRDQEDLSELPKYVDENQSGVAKGSIKWTEQPALKVLRWAEIDTQDTNEGNHYKFYWDDWADNIPVCQNVDDVFTLCSTFLNLSGVKIGQDPTLLSKLTRIGVHSLANDHSPSNKARWIDLSKRLLVPSLSLTKQNSGTVNEVYDLIKHFPTVTRYGIYAEWYTGQISRLPDIQAAFEQSKAETRDVLKRISKTNLKPMARALAKVATSSPGIVFTVAIGQIESYENLVDVVVECARYFTYLGYDVLTWSLMNSLGAHGRNRVQADGMLTSKWLLALSLFAGKVFKRYSFMDPTPILRYVCEQLRKGNTTDLIVLEEMTSSMAGIVTDTNFNELQVIAMAGGQLLQSQTMLQLLDRRHESKVTARRLLKSLVEPKLAGQLLVSIAQELQTCVYKIAEADAHTKLLGNLYDEIHRVLTQYLDLLRSNLSIKDFDALVPSVSQLIAEFGIRPSVAFWISRPSITFKITEHDKQAAAEAAAKKALKPVPEDAPKDVEIAETGTATSPKEGEVEQASASSSPKPATNRDTEMATEGSPQEEPRPATPAQPMHPVVASLMEEVKQAMPEGTWETISESFFTTFWTLGLGDMIVPTQSYDDELNRQKKKIIAINADRSDISIAGTKKKDHEKKLIVDLQDALRAELKDQVTVYTQTRSRLVKEKEIWFERFTTKSDTDVLNQALLEHCFFPRMIASPVDAIYTFKILKLLHSSGAKNFRTLLLLDKFFNTNQLTSMIFLCTNKEAENMARFLNEVLKDLSRWHGEQATYEKEAWGPKKDLPGYRKKMTPPDYDSFLEYEEFRRLLLKWHMNLNTALKNCFGGGEYMHIRNAISILRTIYLHFPVVNWMGLTLVASVTDLSKKESREDLKLAAKSLLGNLKRREKDWVMPQAFSLNQTKPGAGGPNGVRSGSAAAGTPQPDGRKSLNAAALEFKPNTPSGSVKSAEDPLKKSNAEDDEDGEIGDGTLAPKPEESSTTKTSDAMVVDQEDSSAAEQKKTDTPNANPIQISTTVKPTPPSTLPSRPESRSAQLPQRPTNRNPPPPQYQGGRAQPTTGRSEAVAPPPRFVEPRGGDRQMRGMGQELTRGPERLPDRPPFNERDRHDSREQGAASSDRRPPTHDSRGYTEERSDRQRQPSAHTDGRKREDEYRASRDPQMAPPINPQRAQLLMNGSHGADRRDPHGDYSHSQPNSHRGSRNSSPHPRDSQYPVRGEHPLRDGSRPGEDFRRSSGLPPPPRYDDSRPPAGPRSDRASDSHSNNPSERLRDTFRDQGPPPADPGRGRLIHDSGPPPRSQESRYGRLTNEPPLGPRSTSNSSQQAPPRPSRDNLNRTQVNTHDLSSTAPERQTPTGPASARPNTRNQAAASNSAPPTPSSESPNLSGIHPDRLVTLQKEGILPQSPTSASPTAPHAAPSGPRGSIGSINAQSGGDTGPANNSRPVNPPNGPQGGDRTRGDKRWQGLNSVLQQNSGPASPGANQGTSIRGRGARNNQNITVSPTTPTVPSPLAPARGEQSGPPMHPSRAESVPDWPVSENNAPQHGANESREDDRDRRSTRRRDGRSLSPRRGGPAQADYPRAGPPMIARDDGRGGPLRREDDLMRRANGPPRRDDRAAPPRQMPEAPPRHIEGRELRSRGNNGPPPPMAPGPDRGGRRDDRDLMGPGMMGKDRDWRGDGRGGVEIRGGSDQRMPPEGGRRDDRGREHERDGRTRGAASERKRGSGGLVEEQDRKRTRR